MDESLSPMAILDKARKAVPAVNYALGVAGVAAAAAIVSWLVGKNNSSIILLSSSFVGMILLFIFSRLVVSTAPSIQFAGVVLVWIVLVFFATFLVFTTTAFVLTWPCNWAEVLGLTSDCSISVHSEKPGTTAEADPPAGSEVPETRISEFVIMPLVGGERSRRDWKRVKPDLWIETYPNGIQSYFDVKARIIVGGCPGTMAIDEAQHSHRVFIPDKGCAGMPFRINDNNQGWGIVGEMVNIR